jgi:intracellular sulfur oxidation DsrE/DsrF family protein
VRRLSLFFIMAAFALVCMISASHAKNVAAKPVAISKMHQAPKTHSLVIQVDQNDPGVMNLALNNATNVIEYYRAKGEDVDVDVVTYGPGLHMLRADTSPVQDRIKSLKDSAFPSKIRKHPLKAAGGLGRDGQAARSARWRRQFQGNSAARSLIL